MAAAMDVLHAAMQALHQAIADINTSVLRANTRIDEAQTAHNTLNQTVIMIQNQSDHGADYSDRRSANRT